MTGLIRGVDVSAIQTTMDLASWQAIKAAGIAFAMMRTFVGNETWIDASAAQNIDHAEAAGVSCGRYGFAYPLRTIDPKAQVEDWVSRMPARSVGEITFAMDLEWPPREAYKGTGPAKVLTYPWRDQWKIDAPFIRDWSLTALERGYELTGTRWLLYSFRYFLACIDAASASDFAQYPLWLADYTYSGKVPTEAQAMATKVPGPWTEIAIIQHDGDGGLRLPNGRDADFNVMLGGVDRLNALAAPVAPAIDTPVVDPEASRLEVEGGIVDDMIASYRRERIDVDVAA